MMDLRCEWAVVDTVSVLGTDQNVTTHVTKWQVDAEGVRQRFQGRNRQQQDIKLFDDAVSETIEQLVENGEDAVSVDKTTFQYALNENEYLFVDFFASWCSHVSVHSFIRSIVRYFIHELIAGLRQCVLTDNIAVCFCSAVIWLLHGKHLPK